MELQRIGDASLGWGESVVWDECTSRLLFVDCAASTLHWLEGGDGALQTMAMPSMATGVVPTEDGRLVVVLDDGLHVVDVDAGTTELLARSRPTSAVGATTPAPISTATSSRAS